MRPIGILGGTFDPIHYGHLRPALELLEQIPLREIRFILCRNPVHRSPPVASVEQRLSLLRLALGDVAGLVVDCTELNRDGPSYTVETLIELRNQLGTQVPLCLIVGSDAFAGLDKWHRWRELLDLAHIIVMSRAGNKLQVTGELAELLNGALTNDPHHLQDSIAGAIVKWPVTPLAISASYIRQEIKAGRSVRFLLPEMVAHEIETHGLYHHGARAQTVGS